MISACNSTSDASSHTIYATQVEFTTGDITLCLGDTYTIGDSEIVVSPYNANVPHTFSADNSAIASVEGNVITANAIGSTVVRVMVKRDDNTSVFDTINVKVVKVPVYCTYHYFASSSVVVENGSSATNKFSYNLDTDFTPVINYDKGGIVQYDLATGVVTTLANGTDTVQVTCRTGKDQYVTESFDVTVVTYIDNISIANASDTMTFYMGDSGKFEYSIYPTDATVQPIFVGNSVLSVDQQGNYTTTDIGSGSISVEYVTVGGVRTSKTYNVVVLPLPTAIDMHISGANHLAVSAGVDGSYYTYQLTITSNINFETVDLDKITLIDLNNKKVNIVSKRVENGNMVLDVTFAVASTYNLSVTYVSHSYCGDVRLTSQNVSVATHNIITDIVVTSTGAPVVDNTLTLYTCGGSNHPSSTSLAVVPNVTQSLGYTCSVLDSTIATLKEGNLTAVAPGTTQLVVRTNDGYLGDIVIKICVVQCVVTDIIVPGDQVLYVDGTSDKHSSSYAVNVTTLPDCVSDVAINIQADNDCVLIEGNVLVANRAGVSVVSVSCGDINKTFQVEVRDLPNKIVIVDVTQPVTILAGVQSVCEFVLMHNDVVIDYNLNIVVQSDQGICSIGHRVLTVTFDNVGDYSVTIGVEGLDVSTTILYHVVDTLVVPTTGIECEDISINYYEATSAPINYILVPSTSTEGVTYNYDSTYIDITNGVMTLKATCADILIPVNVVVTITSGQVTKDINVNIANFVPITSVEQLSNALPASGAYGLTCDLDISALPSADVMNCLIIGNGYKLTNMNKTFAYTISANAGLYEVQFDGVNFTTDVCHQCSTDNVSVNANPIIAGVNNGVIYGVSVNAITLLANVAVVAVNNGVIDNFNLHFGITTNKYYGFVYYNAADATISNCVLDYTITTQGEAQTFYALCYTIKGIVTNVDMNININCKVDTTLYVISMSADADKVTLITSTIVGVTEQNVTLSVKAARGSAYDHLLGSVTINNEIVHSDGTAV